MLAERCVLESAVRPRWVWAALTDASTIGRWSGFDRFLDDGAPRLETDTERTCSMDVGGHRMHATLTVLEARENECLVLRTETAIATVFETLHLRPAPSHGTTLVYELDVSTPLLTRSLRPWVVEHVGIVHHGLEEFLAADGYCTTLARGRDRAGHAGRSTDPL